MARADGIHWRTGAAPGGREGARDPILTVLAPDAPTIVNEPEARHHYAAIAQARPDGLTVWRAAPQQKPAQVGYDPARMAEAIFINLDFHWARTGVYPRDVLVLNELSLNYERGDDRSDTDPSLWEALYARLATFLDDLLGELRARAAAKGWDGVRWWFPAWSPGHGEETYAHLWVPVARRYDGVCFHSYTTREHLTAATAWHARTFPGRPLLLGEWDMYDFSGDWVAEEARCRARLRTLCERLPELQCVYYIWRWGGGETAAYDVEGHDRRLALWDGRAPLPADEPFAWDVTSSVDGGGTVDPSIPSGPPAPPAWPDPVEPSVSEPWQPSVDPWTWWSAETIARVAECPVETVRWHVPQLADALAKVGLWERPVAAALFGTVAIETASRFEPVEEAFYLGAGAEAYRRTLAYYPWYGRGSIQLTHRSNYEAYSRKLAELWDHTVSETFLTEDPARMLDPWVSAAVAALYFRDHGGDGAARIAVAARAGDWREVRRLVQGGAAGLDRLQRIATALLGQAAGVPDLAGYVFPVQGYTGPINLHWDNPAGIGGTDIFAPRGTPVLAIADGRVVYRAAWGPVGGNAVQLDHLDDPWQSYYAHGDREPLVGDGQIVRAGTLLFGVGDSGNAAGRGTHLHLGMGEEILTGSGVTGGCGSNFNAVDFLRRLQAGQVPPPGEPDELARLRAEVAELTSVLGYLTGEAETDVAGALQRALDGLHETARDIELSLAILTDQAGAIQAAIDTLRSKRPAA